MGHPAEAWPPRQRLRPPEPRLCRCIGGLTCRRYCPASMAARGVPRGREQRSSRRLGVAPPRIHGRYGRSGADWGRGARARVAAGIVGRAWPHVGRGGFGRDSQQRSGAVRDGDGKKRPRWTRCMVNVPRGGSIRRPVRNRSPGATRSDRGRKVGPRNKSDDASSRAAFSIGPV